MVYSFRETFRWCLWKFRPKFHIIVRNNRKPSSNVSVPKILEENLLPVCASNAPFFIANQV